MTYSFEISCSTSRSICSSRSRSSSRPRHQRPRLCITFISYAQSIGKPILNVPTLLNVDCCKLQPPPFPLQTRYTGLDWQVSETVFSYTRNASAYEHALDDIYANINHWTPKTGIMDVAVLIRCTMGMHRSVAMAEAMAEEVAGWSRVNVRCEHLDLTEAIGMMEEKGYGPYKRRWRNV